MLDDGTTNGRDADSISPALITEVLRAISNSPRLLRWPTVWQQTPYRAKYSHRFSSYASVITRANMPRFCQLCKNRLLGRILVSPDEPLRHCFESCTALTHKGHKIDCKLLTLYEIIILVMKGKCPRMFGPCLRWPTKQDPRRCRGILTGSSPGWPP